MRLDDLARTDASPPWRRRGHGQRQSGSEPLAFARAQGMMEGQLRQGLNKDPRSRVFAQPTPSSVPSPAAAPCLADARDGDVLEVVEVLGDDPLALRLAAAGLWPGVMVERICRAPFGDPLLFRLHGYRLALRRSEAERVLVRAPEPRR
jgi:ferrous iron transport protein A